MGVLVSFGANGAPTFAGADFLIGAAVAWRARRARRGRCLFDDQQALPRRLPPVRGRWTAWQRHPRPARVGHRVSWLALRSTSRSTTISRERSASATARRATCSSSPTVNFYEPAGPATIQTRTVNAVQRRGSAPPRTSNAALSNVDAPEVTYNSKDGQVLGVVVARTATAERRHVSGTPHQPGRHARRQRHADDRELRRLRFAGHRLQRASRHVFPRHPRPRARRRFRRKTSAQKSRAPVCRASSST